MANDLRVIQPTLHHVGIVTMNVDLMIEWYSKVLGMKPNFQFLGLSSNKDSSSVKAALLTNDRANHRIAILSWPGLSDNNEKHKMTRLQHFAFEYKTIRDLCDTYSRLRDLAILPVIAVDHRVVTSLYYHDPDKNSVELFVDNFGDWDRSSEYMKQIKMEEFSYAPIDPNMIVAALNAGAIDKEIFQRLSSGEFAPSKPIDMSILASL
jgi:catechol 2,3-dioxygenase